MNWREKTESYFKELQDRITAGIEDFDGTRFRQDAWSREGGGGGRTRILEERKGFRKGRRELFVSSWESAGRIRSENSARHRHVIFCHRNIARLSCAKSHGAGGSCKLSIPGKGRCRLVRRRHGSDAVLSVCRRRDPLSPDDQVSMRSS